MLSLLMLFLVADNGVFADVDFETARKQAARQDKLLMVDFYATWCAPCKMLDRTTWRDQNVLDWLKRHTVAIKLDAEVETKLAGTYKVREYPTLLFLNGDGKERDRITGYVPPNAFVQRAERIRQGRDELAPFRQAMDQEEGAKDPVLRMRLAHKLVQKGEYKEALTHYLWAWDEGVKHQASFEGVRTSFLLQRIKTLTAKYPPATAALRERRDAALAKLNQGDIEAIADLMALNKTLGDQDQSLTLFDKAHKEAPQGKTAKAFFEAVRPKLKEQRRYTLIKEYADLDALLEQAFTRHARFQSTFDQKDDPHAAMMRKTGGELLLTVAVDVYEIRLGLGEEKGASEVASRLIEAQDTVTTYHALAKAGLTSGKPVTANLQQAKTAHERDAKSVGIIETYARLLAHFDRQNEAVTLLEGALLKTTRDKDQTRIQKLLKDIRGA